MNYLTLIKDNYHLLSKNEKKVADYILNNSLDAYDLSVGDLAEKSGTVRSCVMRFTKKIGYSSYTSLRLDTAKDTEEEYSSSMDLVENFTKSSSLSEMISKTESFYTNTVSKTYQYLNPKKLEEAIVILKKAKRIYLIGEGTSLLVAKDLCRKFILIGIDSFCFDDGPTQLTLANNLKPDDCLIAISYSGQSNIANIAVKRAKELNCPSIAICQSCKSNMAQKSTVPIFVPKLEQERKIGSIASRLSCTIVTDILYLGTIQSELDTVTKNVSQARKLLSSLKQKKTSEN